MGFTGSNPHQVGPAVQDVTALSSFPKEPIVLVPSSEQFGVALGSGPSKALVANPVEDVTGLPSWLVMPVVADLQVIDVSVPQSLEQVVFQVELSEPDVNVASSGGVFEWYINDYAIYNSKTLLETLEIASR